MFWGEREHIKIEKSRILARGGWGYLNGRNFSGEGERMDHEKNEPIDQNIDVGENLSPGNLVLPGEKWEKNPAFCDSRKATGASGGGDKGTSGTMPSNQKLGRGGLDKKKGKTRAKNNKGRTYQDSPTISAGSRQTSLSKRPEGIGTLKVGTSPCKRKGGGFDKCEFPRKWGGKKEGEQNNRERRSKERGIEGPDTKRSKHNKTAGRYKRKKKVRKRLQKS